MFAHVANTENADFAQAVVDREHFRVAAPLKSTTGTPDNRLSPLHLNRDF